MTTSTQGHATIIKPMLALQNHAIGTVSSRQMATATTGIALITGTMGRAISTESMSVDRAIALVSDRQRITATPLLVTITRITSPVTSTERMSEIRALVFMDAHQLQVTAILINVLITNTLVFVTDTDRISVVLATVLGLVHQTIITAILFVQTTCTRIVDPAMGIKSTWEVRAHALVSDLTTTTVITLSVSFTSTSVLVTNTTITWVVQAGAMGQDLPMAAATTDTAQIIYTVAYATKEENTSTLPLTALG